jgi:hypothetical protein
MKQAGAEPQDVSVNESIPDVTKRSRDVSRVMEGHRIFIRGRMGGILQDLLRWFLGGLRKDSTDITRWESALGEVDQQRVIQFFGRFVVVDKNIKGTIMDRDGYLVMIVLLYRDLLDFILNVNIRRCSRSGLVLGGVNRFAIEDRVGTFLVSTSQDDGFDLRRE